jgi:phosphoribosyl 1,2-cyclic phosphodiesterase
MSVFYVRFWGTRGSIPTPGVGAKKYGGNTSCVEIRVDDTLFICDGGTGLRELGVDLMRRSAAPITGHLFFSHTHWDHIQGFPFFTPAYLSQNTFHVYGTAEGDRRTYELLSGQMRSVEYFPVDFAELRSNVVASHIDDGRRRIDGVSVKIYEQTHPGRSWAWSFEKDGTKVVFATDNEIDLAMNDEARVIADLDAPRRIPPELVEFVRGADLLVADGQYLDEEYPTKVGWGHPRATTVVDLAVQGNVKQLAIFHHDPMHSDADVDRKIVLCRERALRASKELVVFGAREGLELRIGGADRDDPLTMPPATRPE